MIDTVRTGWRRWEAWSRQSVNRRILGSALVVGSLSLLVKMAAAAKDITAARFFGTGDSMDAYLMALLVPSMAAGIAAGSFGASFMPVFIRVLEREGHEAAQRLLSSALFLNVVLLALVSVLLALAVPHLLPFLASGFGPDKLARSRHLFCLLLPILPAVGVSGAWGAVLNATGNFSLAAISPAAAPLVSLLLLGVAGGTLGIHALIAGVVAGSFAEAWALARRVRRTGFSPVPRWRGASPAVREVAGQYAPMALGAFLMSGTVLINQSMAAALGAGSVAALDYGGKVVSLVQGVGSLALGTAVLPYFSRMTAGGDWGGARRTLRTYAVLALKIAVPLTALLMLFSEPLVRLLFQRGSFTESDALLVGRVQVFCLLQLPVFVPGILGVRLLSSLGGNRSVMLISGVNLVLCFAGNLVLTRRLGVAGIGLSTSVVYFLSTVLIGLAVSRRLGEMERGDGRRRS